MVDKTKITSIDIAKAEKYDNRDLDTAEKAIFEHASLKKADGTADLIKLGETAELLEKVIKAKKLQTYDKTKHDELIQEKAAKDYAYNAINSCNNMYEGAVTNLVDLKSKKAPTPTETSIETQISQIDASINAFKAEKDAKTEYKNSILAKQSSYLLEKSKEQEN